MLDFTRSTLHRLLLACSFEIILTISKLGQTQNEWRSECEILDAKGRAYEMDFCPNVSADLKHVDSCLASESRSLGPD